jgi:hypothetical protein
MSATSRDERRSADKTAPTTDVVRISVRPGVPPPFRVEVTTLVLAEALRRRLPLETEIAAVDGHYEVGIELRGRNPEKAVVSALKAIDSWLLESGVPSVRIHLDGTSHTLHAWP